MILFYYLAPAIYTLIIIFMTGTVKWFDSKKGYGFIASEDGKEYFVHFSGVQTEGFKSLTEKQEVEFELTTGNKGEQAINVKVIG